MKLTIHITQCKVPLLHIFMVWTGAKPLLTCYINLAVSQAFLSPFNKSYNDIIHTRCMHFYIAQIISQPSHVEILSGLLVYLSVPNKPYKPHIDIRTVVRLRGLRVRNPPGGMDVCVLWVLCLVRWRSLRRVDRRPEQSFRICVCPWVRSDAQITLYTGS